MKLNKKKNEIVLSKADEDMHDIIMAGKKGKLCSFLRIMKTYFKSPVKK